MVVEDQVVQDFKKILLVMVVEETEKLSNQEEVFQVAHLIQAVAVAADGVLSEVGDQVDLEK